MICSLIWRRSPDSFYINLLRHQSSYSKVNIPWIDIISKTTSTVICEFTRKLERTYGAGFYHNTMMPNKLLHKMHIFKYYLGFNFESFTHTLMRPCLVNSLHFLQYRVSYSWRKSQVCRFVLGSSSRSNSTQSWFTWRLLYLSQGWIVPIC